MGPLVVSEEGCRYIIVAIDSFTKNFEIAALKTQSADETIKFIITDIIARHGIPKIILTDNGKNFIATAVDKTYEMLGIVGKKVNTLQSTR
jgi:transposase InsO family protein